jgi:DNA-binding response OmpR family regulator
MARILVVEDEQRLAATLKRGLEAEGFAVDVALNGVDGEWLAGQGNYDAILLDIMLPGKDGLSVCAGLRSAGIWTPVLMLTARNGPRDEVRSLDTGADDYLAKPFSFMVLVARVRALLRRGAGERPPVLEAGDLHLDPAARRCERDGVEIELTSREFAVLEFLMRRKGDVVSKGAVLDNVWDFAFEGDPNIVEVYLRRLRRKVDEPFGRRSLETVRGAGYRLRSDGR